MKIPSGRRSGAVPSEMDPLIQAVSRFVVLLPQPCGDFRLVAFVLAILVSQALADVKILMHGLQTSNAARFRRLMLYVLVTEYVEYNR
jgi:hypothetical protein